MCVMLYSVCRVVLRVTLSSVSCCILCHVVFCVVLQVDAIIHRQSEQSSPTAVHARICSALHGACCTIVKCMCRRKSGLAECDGEGITDSRDASGLSADDPTIGSVARADRVI